MTVKQMIEPELEWAFVSHDQNGVSFTCFNKGSLIWGVLLFHLKLTSLLLFII